MNSIFNLIIIPIFVTGGCLLLFIIIKSFFIYKHFRNYLLSIDDNETLRKIRRLNPFGQRVFPSSPFTISKVHNEILEKYKQTEDVNYLLFDKKYMLCVRQVAILAITLFMLFVFYQILSH